MDQIENFLTVHLARDGGLIDGKLSGSFDADSVRGFEAEVDKVAPGRRREFSFDVSELTHADPSFVDALLRLRTAHGHVALVNPSAAVRRLLAETGANQVLVVRDRRD